jgi:hypothetical protein
MWKEFATWYSQTARLVGYPILFVILITAVEKTMFTVTCSLGGYQCEHSIIATDAAMDYVSELVTGKQNEELASKQSRR